MARRDMTAVPRWDREGAIGGGAPTVSAVPAVVKRECKKGAHMKISQVSALCLVAALSCGPALATPAYVDGAAYMAMSGEARTAYVSGAADMLSRIGGSGGQPQRKSIPGSGGALHPRQDPIAAAKLQRLLYGPGPGLPELRHGEQFPRGDEREVSAVRWQGSGVTAAGANVVAVTEFPFLRELGVESSSMTGHLSAQMEREYARDADQAKMARDAVAKWSKARS